MEEVPKQISVENLVSCTKRLGWQGNKVWLEVDTDKEDEAKLLLIGKCYPNINLRGGVI